MFETLGRMGIGMNRPICAHLRLHFQSNPIAAFFPLLQTGFYVELTPGNLQALLSRICDIEYGKVRDRIQTIFLNGKPVDDLEAVYVKDGDSLALSAAMPGLVGATMRSGGVLAGFRQSISHRSRRVPSHSHQGYLLIKLFNLLIKEIGPRILQKGILMEPGGIGKLIESILETDPQNCKRVQLDSRVIDAQDLMSVQWPQGPGLIHLQVGFGPPSEGMGLPQLNSAGEPGTSS